MDIMESIVGDLDTWIPDTWWGTHTCPHTWWGADMHGGLASFSEGPGWGPGGRTEPKACPGSHHVSGIQVSRSPTMESMVSMESICLFRLIGESK